MIPTVIVILALLIIAPRLGQGSSHYEGGQPVGSKTDQFIAWLRAQKNKPYSGTNPQGPGHWDCSGLVQGAYASIGVTVGRVVTYQAEEAPRKISVKDNFATADEMKAALRPGDAIGTGWNSSVPPYPAYPAIPKYKHTGIWTGNSIIHSSSSKGKVVEVPFSSWWFTEGRTIYAYPQN